MATTIKKLASRGAKAAKKAYHDVETAVLARQAKRAAKKKVRVVKEVTKKAAKAALVSGALAAASVISEEIAKRRRLRG